MDKDIVSKRHKPAADFGIAEVIRDVVKEYVGVRQYSDSVMRVFFKQWCVHFAVACLQFFTQCTQSGSEKKKVWSAQLYSAQEWLNMTDASGTLI